MLKAKNLIWLWIYKQVIFKTDISKKAGHHEAKDRPAPKLASLAKLLLLTISWRIMDVLDKVVVQCFDDTPVMPSGLNGVQAKFKERAPMALLIHCYAHRHNLMLIQGASKIRECKIFFAHFNAPGAFFS